MDLNELKELSLDELKTLQQEVEDAIKNIILTCHYEIGDILLQKTDYCVKIFKILDKNYDEEWGWEYKADVIKFEKTNIIKQTGDYFYTESFELGNIKTIKVDEDTWNTLDALHDKYKDQLDKVFDEWKKKEDFIRDKCMEELWKILNKEL
jgi:hypothetical protein